MINTNIFSTDRKASFIFISTCLYDILGTFLLTLGLGHSTSLEGRRGYVLAICYWGCVAGWGHIFMTGLTIMGLHCQ